VGGGTSGSAEVGVAAGLTVADATAAPFGLGGSLGAVVRTHARTSIAVVNDAPETAQARRDGTRDARGCVPRLATKFRLEIAVGTMRALILRGRRVTDDRSFRDE
jgi:hypothetical protein